MSSRTVRSGPPGKDIGSMKLALPMVENRTIYSPFTALNISCYQIYFTQNVMNLTHIRQGKLMKLHALCTGSTD